MVTNSPLATENEVSRTASVPSGKIIPISLNARDSPVERGWWSVSTWVIGSLAEKVAARLRT